MARKSNRDKFRKKLKKRTQESHSRRDEQGGFKDYFSDAADDINKWWAGKGEHIIDVVPYMAGPNDPRNREGEPAYVLDIEVHRYVGPMDEMTVCPEQFKTGHTFAGPCPICEEARRRSKNKEDWKTRIKPLKPSRRCIYNVIVRDGQGGVPGEAEKKGVQIWEIAHWFSEKHFSKISKDPRGDGFTVFSDPDDGKSICFERTGTGSENTGYDGFQFTDRPDPITDDELDDAKCLDELIEVKSYDEIDAIFNSTAKPDGEQEPDKQDEQEPDDGNEPDPSDGDEQGQDEPEPESKKDKKDKKPLTRRGDKDKGKKRGKGLECPAGGTMGEDIDDFNECEDCSIYDECEAIADTM